MDGYVARALKRFKHIPSSTRTQHSPHPWNAPIYGKKIAQRPTLASSSPTLDATATQRIQAIAGTFLYYSEIDPCIKPCLNSIGTEQACPTESTNEKAQMLMDYLHDHPNGILRYHASAMILSLEADAAYLVLPKAKSRAAAWFVLGNDPTQNPIQTKNSPLHIMCNTIKNVMSSAAEAETGGIFMAVQRACPIRAPSPNSVTHNLLTVPLSTTTTPLPQASSTQPCARNYPKYLTCASTGSKTANNKNNFNSFGERELQTWRTTLRNIIPHGIANKCDTSTSIKPSPLSWYGSRKNTNTGTQYSTFQSACKGVLLRSSLQHDRVIIHTDIISFTDRI